MTELKTAVAERLEHRMSLAPPSGSNVVSNKRLRFWEVVKAKPAWRPLELQISRETAPVYCSGNFGDAVGGDIMRLSVLYLQAVFWKNTHTSRKLTYLSVYWSSQASSNMSHLCSGQNLRRERERTQVWTWLGDKQYVATPRIGAPTRIRPEARMSWSLLPPSTCWTSSHVLFFLLLHVCRHLQHLHLFPNQVGIASFADNAR